MCMKEDNLGLKQLEGDYSREIIIFMGLVLFVILLIVLVLSELHV